MTILDGFLILIGVFIIILCTMEGLLRALIGLVGFYIAVTAAGMVTLATDALHDIAISLSRAVGLGVPSITITETIVFLGLAVPLSVGIYLLSKLLFPDTTLPKLHALDNILGLLIGVILATLIMAVLYNTWGVMVSVRWNNLQLWYNMRYAYLGAFLRPYLHQILVYYRPVFFLFALLRYPPFFAPQ